jgi:hypothetical protein
LSKSRSGELLSLSPPYVFRIAISPGVTRQMAEDFLGVVPDWREGGSSFTQGQKSIDVSLRST